MPRFINPQTIAAPGSSYTHGVLTLPHAKRLIISGQIGVKPDGTVAEGMAAQAEQAFSNLGEVIKASQMEVTDIVKTVIYCVNREDIPAMRVAREKFLGTHAPASTLLIISGLASPDFLIEVEAEAVREVG